MSCSQVSPQLCDNQIDYSELIINERILPFVFELDAAMSNLDPLPGENQRFCYRVTGVGEDNSTYVDLSHWVLSLCPNITLDQITNVTVTIGGESQTVIIGDNVELFIPPASDPTTGCSGLKFDFGISKVLDGEDSVGVFCFELTTPYPVGAVPVCVNGGQSSSSDLAICGPVCDSVACTTTASQLVNVCVPITIRPVVRVDTPTTTCCGTAYISTDECIGEPVSSCTFTVSQLICVDVPINFGAVATPGPTLVGCGVPGPGECVCPTPNGDEVD